MAQQDRNQPAAPRARFTFHAARDRFYARNEDGKVIDLGKLAPLVVRAAQDITARVP